MRTLKVSVAAALLAVGCSHQAGFSVVEQQAQHDCQTEPPHAYEACLEEAEAPFSEREREQPEPTVATEEDAIADEILAAPVEERPVVDRATH